MRLGTLRVDNLRLLEAVRVQAHPRLNLVIGANAAGKTSLLEAIYLLGRGKSFRGQSPAELAGPAGRHWLVRGELDLGNRPPASLQVRWAPEGTEALAGPPDTPVSAVELVRRFPVQILEPGMHRLLQEGPSYRRSFLDWGVFHVEHDFFQAWRRFQRALRQRNQALRTDAPAPAVRAWHAELGAAGQIIDRCRRAHLDALRGRFVSLVEGFLDIHDATLDLHAGWNVEQPDYARRLEEHIDRDRKAGTTVEGPHRAELRLRLQAHSARHRVSRGQQKLLIAALLLAQAEQVGAALGTYPVLLCDDFAAELGEPFQRRLLTALKAYAGQVWVTSFDADTTLRERGDSQVFHVEHGRVKRA